jgi:hypothetical protein
LSGSTIVGLHAAEKPRRTRSDRSDADHRISTDPSIGSNDPTTRVTPPSRLTSPDQRWRSRMTRTLGDRGSDSVTVCDRAGRPQSALCPTVVDDSPTSILRAAQRSRRSLRPPRTTKDNA